MIAALILAGGRGTRFGGTDKAFLPLDGRPLLAHLLERLAPQVRTIAISANGDAARFSPYGAPVLPDAPEHADAGPLAGLAAGLAWAASIGAATLATIPVDTPFIPPDLIARLVPGPSVAVHAGRQHHLVALWPTSFAAALTQFIATPGDHRVRDALALAAARPVIFDGEPDPFMNINTPGELEEAKASAAFLKKRSKKPLS
jgi:molybdopterin-guanine dinucleotide biosynthesis protein A